MGFNNQSTTVYPAVLRCDAVSLCKLVPAISKENNAFVFKGIRNVGKPTTQWRGVSFHENGFFYHNDEKNLRIDTYVLL